MKRSLVIMVISIFILTLVSGCKNTEDLLPKTDNKSGKNGNLTIMIGADYSPASLIKVLNDIKNTTNMAITIERVPGAKYQEELEKQLAAGQGPDIFFLPSVSSLNQFQRKGYIADLNSLAQIDHIGWEEYYSSGLMDLVTVNGQVLGLPTDFIPVEFMYWKSIFQKADLPYPTSDWTWDQFLMTATRLTEYMKGYGGKGTNLHLLWAYELEGLLNVNGGTMLSPDGVTTSGYLDSQASLDAIHKIAAAVQKGDISFSYDNSIDSFLKDKSVGMLFGAIGWAKSTLDREGNPVYMDPDLGYVSLPVMNGGKPLISLSSLSAISINAHSKHADAAWKFLRTYFMEESDFTDVLISNGSYISQKASEKSGEQNSYVKEYLRSSQYIYSGTNIFSLHSITAWSHEFESVESLQSILKSGDTGLVKQLIKRLDQLLNE